MDIRDYLRVLRASWVLVLAGLILGGGLATGLSALMTPQYTATTQLFVTITGSDDIATAVQGNYYAEGKVASYAKLLRSKQLVTNVIGEAGLDLTPQTLIDRLSVEVVPDTTILDISVTDTSAERATAIAGTVAREFRAMVQELETPDGETKSPVRVTVIAAPELPQEPSSPALVPNALLGAVVGLFLAAVVAVVRDLLDTTVKDDDAAAALAGAPVIGHLPSAAELSGVQPPEPQSTSAAAEAIRHVRANLAFVDVDNPPRTILVTSSVPGEGKTTLAVNLAVALAEAGNTVTLVEADLRRPRAARYLGLVSGVGLTSVLTGAASIDDVIQPVRNGALQVLAAGPLPPNPSELLSSAAMSVLIDELSRSRDIVVIDAPPLLPVADAAALAGLVDGVLLAAQWGSVDTHELERSGAMLSRLGAKLLGVVMTQVPGRSAAVAYGYSSDAATWTPRRGVVGRLFSLRTTTVAPVAVPSVRPRAAKAATPRRAARPTQGPAPLFDTSGR
jgi:capsular exopolysaccharide synthesis family protein